MVFSVYLKWDTSVYYFYNNFTIILISKMFEMLLCFAKKEEKKVLGCEGIFCAEPCVEFNNTHSADYSS